MGLDCMGLAPNSSHFLTPVQGLTGCGFFHRKSPTGGAANGMPLYAMTSLYSLLIPDTSPDCVATGVATFILGTLGTKAQMSA